MNWSVFLLVIYIFGRFFLKNRWDKLSWRMFVFFLLYWVIAVMWSEFGVYGISKVSQSTYSLLSFGIVAFTIGYSIVNTRSQNGVVDEDKIATSVLSISTNKVFVYFLGICTIYILTLYVTFFQTVMLLGSMTEARGEAYSGDLYGYFFGLVDSLLLTPLNAFVLPLWSILLVQKKRNVFFWIATVFLMIFAGLKGGRIEYVRIALVVYFIAFCLFDKAKQKKRFAIYSIFAVAGVFMFLVFTTALRNGVIGLNQEAFDVGSEKTIEQLQTYSAGPISALDYGINNNYEEQIGGYQYGRITLTSLDRFCCLILRQVGVNAHDAMEKFADIKQNSWIDIGDIHFNALYTAFMPFYLDFGKYGMILLPFLLGIIIRKSINWMYLHFNIYSISLLSIFFYALVRTTTDWIFYNPMDVVLLVFLIYKGNNQHNEKKC